MNNSKMNNSKMNNSNNNEWQESSSNGNSIKEHNAHPLHHHLPEVEEYDNIKSNSKKKKQHNYVAQQFIHARNVNLKDILWMCIVASLLGNTFIYKNHQEFGPVHTTTGSRNSPWETTSALLRTTTIAPTNPHGYDPKLTYMLTTVLGFDISTNEKPARNALDYQGITTFKQFARVKPQTMNEWTQQEVSSVGGEQHENQQSQKRRNLAPSVLEDLMNIAYYITALHDNGEISKSNDPTKWGENDFDHWLRNDRDAYVSSLNSSSSLNGSSSSSSSRNMLAVKQLVNNANQNDIEEQEQEEEKGMMGDGSIDENERGEFLEKVAEGVNNHVEVIENENNGNNRDDSTDEEAGVAEVKDVKIGKNERDAFLSKIKEVADDEEVSEATTEEIEAEEEEEEDLSTGLLSVFINLNNNNGPSNNEDGEPKLEPDRVFDGTPRVAVIISGQLGRFIYEDNKGPLLAPDKNGIKPIVDVYIALHVGKMAKPYFRNLQPPPYIHTKKDGELKKDDLEVIESEVKEFFKEVRGANEVYVKLIDDDELAKTNLFFFDKDFPEELDDSYLLKHIQNKKLYSHNKHRGQKKNQKIKLLRDRVLPNQRKKFHQNTRMLYMRHVAYKMALEQSMYKHHQKYHYDAFVSQREDTYFYEPLDLERIGFDYEKSNVLNHGGTYSSTTASGVFLEQEEPIPRPYMMLENVCKWGSYSDKIHVGNQLAMKLLFGANWNGFINLTKSRIEFGHRTAHSRPELYTFQTEAFLQNLLKSKSSEVMEVDFKRVDARYSQGKLCVAHLYHECQTTRTKKILADEHNISRCFHTKGKK